MKLSTRLTALLIAMTTVVAMLVGWFAVATSSRADYSSLDNTINAVIASGKGHPLTALTSALYIVQQNNYDVTLDVVGASGRVTQIATGDVPLTRAPSVADVHHSVTAVRSTADLPGFRYQSISIGGGDYLVVAKSTRAVAQRIHQLVVGTLIVGLIAALLMGLVARLFMRRDLRTIEELISFATSVAHGDVEGSVPRAEGSSDIRELQTALSQMVVSLQRTIATEQRISQTTQQFIGDASHELRTPLTVIKGYADLLASAQVNDEQRRRALERVRKEVNRMDGLVNDLLFLAEVSEMPVLEDAPVALSALVTSSAADFAVDYPTRTLTTEIEPHVAVRGRFDYFERLMMNSLTNIARHTHESDAVKISLHRAGPRVRLRVEDAGPGLPEHTYGTRPERFQRFDESRSRATGGSGLGMSIMADIAAALHGTMATSRSDLGGLAMTFDFPLDRGPSGSSVSATADRST